MSAIRRSARKNNRLQNPAGTSVTVVLEDR